MTTTAPIFYPIRIAALFSACLLAAPVTAANKPEVADSYRKSFDRVWAKADAGESPLNACASVVGRAVSALRAPEVSADVRADATEAVHACYVVASSHYLERSLDAVEAGKAECGGMISSGMMRKMSLGGFLKDAGATVEDYEQQINDRVAKRLTALCPDYADSILAH